MQVKTDDEVLRIFKLRSKITGFRLDDEHRLILFRRANILRTSANELARLYVIERLHEGNERDEIKNTIMSLGRELIELRKDVAVSTQEILVSAGKATVSQAKEWAKANLT